MTPSRNSERIGLGRGVDARTGPRRRPRTGHRRVSILEQLEGRRLPSVTSAVDPAGVLTVSSDAGDPIAIGTSPDGRVTIDGANPGTGAFLAAGLTGMSIRGGPGANRIDLRAFDILRFPVLQALTIDGGGGNDLLLAPQVSTSFYVTGPDQGILGGPAFAPLAISTFQAIPNLGGGPAADSFVFGSGSSLSGAIQGDGGGDTLDLSDLSDPQSVKLTGSSGSGFRGTATALGGGFDGIGSVVGGPAQGTLVGEDVASTWTLDGTPTYSDGRQTLAFQGFQGLQGGDAGNVFDIIGDAMGQFTADLIGGHGDDQFRFLGFAQLVGDIDGGEGFDTLSYADFGSSVAVQLTGSDATGFAGTESSSFSGGGFRDIDRVIASPPGDGPSILIGEDVPSNWSLGPDSKYSDGSGSLAFVDFGIVQGGPASVDTFQVTASPLSWTIIGGSEGSPSGDVLQVDAGGRAATLTPTEVRVDGMGTIAYSGIGSVNVLNQAGPGLVLDQSHTPEPATVGQDVDMVLTVNNPGPTAAAQVVLSDALPAGLALVSATASQGAVGVVGRTLTADLGALAVGGQAMVRVTLRPRVSGAWVNSALVADRDPDVHSALVVSSQTINVVGTTVDTTDLRVVALQPRGGGSKRTSIVLSFNQSLDPASAGDLSHYKIIGPVRGGRFRRRDNRGIRIKRVIYEPARQAVILLPAVRLPLGRTFLLSVSGVSDAHGDLLDGAGDGQQGSPYGVLFHGHHRVPPQGRSSSSAEIGSSAWSRTPG